DLRPLGLEQDLAPGHAAFAARVDGLAVEDIRDLVAVADALDRVPFADRLLHILIAAESFHVLPVRIAAVPVEAPRVQGDGVRPGLEVVLVPALLRLGGEARL